MILYGRSVKPPYPLISAAGFPDKVIGYRILFFHVIASNTMLKSVRLASRLILTSNKIVAYSNSSYEGLEHLHLISGLLSSVFLRFWYLNTSYLCMSGSIYPLVTGSVKSWLWYAKRNKNPPRLYPSYGPCFHCKLGLTRDIWGHTAAHQRQMQTYSTPNQSISEAYYWRKYEPPLNLATVCVIKRHN
jgi:hypothetical protein